MVDVDALPKVLTMSSRIVFKRTQILLINVVVFSSVRPSPRETETNFAGYEVSGHRYVSSCSRSASTRCSIKVATTSAGSGKPLVIIVQH